MQQYKETESHTHVQEGREFMLIDVWHMIAYLYSQTYESKGRVRFAT